MATCSKLQGNWKCQRPVGHSGRHGTYPQAGDTTTQPDGTVITICAHCGLWVAGDMDRHVAVCPVARFSRR